MPVMPSNEIHQANETINILNLTISFCVNLFFYYCCLLFHEYDLSVLLRKDKNVELNMLYNFKNPFFLLIVCNKM